MNKNQNKFKLMIANSSKKNNNNSNGPNFHRIQNVNNNTNNNTANNNNDNKKSDSNDNNLFISDGLEEVLNASFLRFTIDDRLHEVFIFIFLLLL
jgi:hypothetical protein